MNRNTIICLALVDLCTIMYFLMDMTPMTNFDETTMSNFHNYNAFTRMSAQMNQTAMKDKASDRYDVK